MKFNSGKCEEKSDVPNGLSILSGEIDRDIVAPYGYVILKKNNNMRT